MFYNKKILALIPARGGSKGIRLKNLKKINNVSLIEHTANFIKKCNFFDETIVSTDSIKISNHAKKLQFQIFKRSKFTSKDHASDFDVISEVLKNKNTLKKKFDYIVYLQPTSPIRKISQLKNALYYLIRK